MSGAQEATVWVGIVLSVVLAIFFPLATWWHLRKPETLREAWLYSKPGRVATGCVVALVLLAVGGLLTATLAHVYPILWGTFVLALGMAVSAAIYLVRFVSFDPQTAIDSLDESDPTTET